MSFKETVYGRTMHDRRRFSSGELKRRKKKNSPQRLLVALSRIRESQLDTCMLCKSKIASFTFCLQGNISYNFVVC